MPTLKKVTVKQYKAKQTIEIEANNPALQNW